jgi:hypothetical protein
MDRIIVNLDLETIPPGDMETFELTKEPPKTLKKPEAIEKWRTDNREKEFRKQAVDPFGCQILVAGITIENESDLDREDFEPEPIALYAEDEEKIIKKFDEILREKLMERFEEGGEIRETEIKDILWVGYNIRKFDLEALWVKAVKYHCYFLANLIPRNRYDKSVYDLLEKIQGPRTMEFVSFNKALELFDLGSKTEGMDGSKVYDAYLEGKLTSHIVPYCIDDIMANRKLFKRLRKAILAS